MGLVAVLLRTGGFKWLSSIKGLLSAMVAHFCGHPFRIASGRLEFILFGFT